MSGVSIFCCAMSLIAPVISLAITGYVQVAPFCVGVICLGGQMAVLTKFKEQVRKLHGDALVRATNGAKLWLTFALFAAALNGAAFGNLLSGATFISAEYVKEVAAASGAALFILLAILLMTSFRELLHEARSTDCS